MLTVEHYELIRRKVLIEGLSQRATAKELGHSRKTVTKALVYRIPPGYRLSEPRPRPVIDAVKGIIDAWLEQDTKAPVKQRQTAQRIYERLREEYGFRGNYGTVQRYIREAAHRHKEVFMPLEFEPGEEAQVDWHEGWIVENGLERKCQFFVMRLCYSKATFVYPYERANVESFLDGHVRAFEYFGGVPRRIAYDNLKCAVIYVGRGKERRLTKRFLELRAWYLFETRFCDVAKGNEKGDVENACKRSERTYLSPVPQVQSLGQLASKLFDDCQNDLGRPGPQVHGGKTVAELFGQEKPCLLPLHRSEKLAQDGSGLVDNQILVYHSCTPLLFMGSVFFQPAFYRHKEAFSVPRLETGNRNRVIG